MNTFASSLIDRELGGYRVTELIGEGGMAVVMRAQNILNPKIERALKIIRPEYADRLQFFERFSREAAVLDLLKSKHIVSFHNLQRSNQLIYMELELLNGYSLDHMPNTDQRPSAMQITEWLYQATIGLAEAHRYEIIHRDIKPANLFIHYDKRHPEGIVKILDFGIAKVLNEIDAERQQTMQGHVLGSPAYMAPEVCEGGESSPQADLYSLSLIAYELLLGHHPFFKDPSSLNTVQVMLTHIKSELPSLASTTEELRGLEEILSRGAAKDPAKRFQSCDEMLAALSSLKVSSTSADINESLQAEIKAVRGEAEIATREMSLEELFGTPTKEPTSLMGPLIAALLCALAIYTVTYEWRVPKQAELVGPRTVELSARDKYNSTVITKTEESPLLSRARPSLSPSITKLKGSAQSKEEQLIKPSKNEQSAESLLERLSFTWISLPQSTGLARSISKTEVTVAQYKLCVDHGACEAIPASFKPNFGQCSALLDDDSLPMNCVTFLDARRFSEWVNQVHREAHQAGARNAHRLDKISLPSEEEWRTASHKLTYPWGDTAPSCQVAVFFERAPSCDGQLGPKPVCSRAAGNNRNGVCDLSGNLWEWVESSTSSSSQNALVLGGAWSSAAIDLRLDHERERPMTTRDPSIGVRLVYRHYIEK